MQSRTIRPDRRRFLKRLGMVSGAGALLALFAGRRRLANPSPETHGAQPRNDRGYRLTAHIRSYYDKAGL